MLEDAKTLKTGCDVICGKEVYHGDLKFADGKFYLAGIPHNSPYSSEDIDKEFHHITVMWMKQVDENVHYKAFELGSITECTQEFYDWNKEWNPRYITLFPLRYLL